MKSKIAALAIGLVGVANGASTIQFSSTTNYATNFLNGAGGISTMVWGIIVDSTRNGFDDGSYLPGFSLDKGASTNAGAPVAMSTSTGPSDDFLIISGNLMNLTTTTTDGATVGLNRITNLSSFSYAGAMDGGDPYKVIWFDSTAIGGTAGGGLKYGTFQPATLNTIPADPTGSISFAPAFAGADPAKSMAFTLVPEPSSLLLGAVGALGLLRRRRI